MPECVCRRHPATLPLLVNRFFRSALFPLVVIVLLLILPFVSLLALVFLGGQLSNILSDIGRSI